ncbi:MAG: hypothetical protein KKI13_05845, partial [Candidatus Omnitrophica bacterium]|nr:hypothetical protein [Candidatus Omnitrophota bacterium]
TAEDFFARSNTSPVFSYSDTKSLEYGMGCNGDMVTITGEGLIHEDPEFIDAANYDYNIADTSPCRGTGLNGADMGAKFE